MVTMTPEVSGFSPSQVRAATRTIPFGDLASSAYEQLYGAGQWYRANIATPANTFLNQAPENPATAFTRGVVNSPAIVAETAAMVAAGTPMLANEMTRRGAPAVIGERTVQGLGMQYQQTVEGFTKRPAEFTGELLGMAVITAGAGKVAGAAARASPIRIRTAEIPTGATKAPSRIQTAIPEVLYKVAGKEKPVEVPVTTRYTALTAERPGSSPTTGRIIAGVARTEQGAETFTGHPAEVMERTPIAMKTPMDVTNVRPWSRGESILMREHLRRTASPEVGEIIGEEQAIQHAVQNPGVRAAVDQQIQSFDLELETFGGKGGAGNRAIVEVLSREKYRGKVITGGSVAQKAYVQEGAYRDVSFSDVDIWVKDRTTARELYGDLVTELKKTGDISRSSLKESGGFDISGRRTDVRGIGAHLLEEFPQLEGQGRTVRTVYGGTMEITSPLYNLRSKMGGAFEGLSYKPGGKTELLVNRAKDIPDISTYSRQAAANLYNKELTADVLSVRTTRREAIAASYERMSTAARRYGLNLEKTGQGSTLEKAKNLKPNEMGTGITVGQKVRQTLTREITRDVLKGNPRTVRAEMDFFNTRGPARGGLSEEALLFARRSTRAVTRGMMEDIYPAGKSYARGRGSRAYPLIITAVSRGYPRGQIRSKDNYTAAVTESRDYPTGTAGGSDYPKALDRGTSYPTSESYKGRTRTGYMGKPPYPTGKTPTTIPREVLRERTRARAIPVVTQIITGKKRRKGDEDLLRQYSRRIPMTAPFLELAPVASDLEMAKGVSNERKRRKTAGK